MIARSQICWEVPLYRALLAISVALSLMLLSAGLSSGFPAFSLTSPISLWACIVIANHFLSLGLQHVFAERFKNPRGALILTASMAVIIVLHLAITLGTG